MFYKHCLCLMKRPGKRCFKIYHSTFYTCRPYRIYDVVAEKLEFIYYIIYFALTYTFSRIFTSKVDSNLLYMTPHFLL